MAQETEWSSRPACRHYLLVYFGRVPLAVRGDDAARGKVALWGLGVLASGHGESLGTWHTPGPGDPEWIDVLRDLQMRGVERVGQFISSEPSKVHPAIEAMFPMTRALPSTHGVLAQCLHQMAPRYRAPAATGLGSLVALTSTRDARAALRRLSDSPWGMRYPAVVERWRVLLGELEPLFALPARLRGVVLSGDAAAHRVQQGLGRALARHGPFADEPAAVAYAGQVLLQVERNLQARGLEAGSRVAIRVRPAGARRASSAPVV